MSDDNYWDDFVWVVHQKGEETERFPTKEDAMKAHPEYTWDNFSEYDKDLHLYKAAFKGDIPCNPSDDRHPYIIARRKEKK